MTQVAAICLSILTHVLINAAKSSLNGWMVLLTKLDTSDGRFRIGSLAARV